MPNLIGAEHAMPGAHHSGWQQKIDHGAGMTLLAIAALHQHRRTMALAIETTLGMGLQLQIADQLLAGTDLRHKKSPVCTEPLGVCEE